MSWYWRFGDIHQFSNFPKYKKRKLSLRIFREKGPFYSADDCTMYEPVESNQKIKSWSRLLVKSCRVLFSSNLHPNFGTLYNTNSSVVTVNINSRSKNGTLKITSRSQSIFKVWTRSKIAQSTPLLRCWTHRRYGYISTHKFANASCSFRTWHDQGVYGAVQLTAADSEVSIRLDDLHRDTLCHSHSIPMIWLTSIMADPASITQRASVL